MSTKILQEMEKLRSELYTVVSDNYKVLNTKEICEVSTKLDQLIVKHMRETLKDSNNNNFNT